jgi:hypothetical protein
VEWHGIALMVRPLKASNLINERMAAMLAASQRAK